MRKIYSQVSKTERRKLLFLRGLTLSTKILHILVRIAGAVGWLFFLNNVANIIVPGYLYTIAGSGTWIGNFVLWLINNVYLKFEAVQYLFLFLSSKALWIGLFGTAAVTFTAMLNHKAIDLEYKHYLKQGYIHRQLEDIQEPKPQSNQSDSSYAKDLELANMKAQLAEQKYEMERMQRLMLEQQLKTSQSVGSGTDLVANDET